jgi:nucleoside-diphosphate-sugar epimerase
MDGGHDVQPIDCIDRDLPAGLPPVDVQDILAASPRFAPGTEAVFYLAQSPYYRDFPAQADHLFGVNSLGPIRAAQAAAEAGVQYFCFTSTGNVYAPSFQSLTEDAPVRRDNPYALSKLMAEEALALFDGDMAIQMGRIFGAFGPGQTSMLPAVLRQRILDGLPIQLSPAETGKADEGLQISFLFVEDLAGGLADLMQRCLGGQAVPSVLNLGGPEAISIRRFADILARNLGKEAIFEITENVRPFDLIADIRRWQDLASPSFTPLEEALARTVNESS